MNSLTITGSRPLYKDGQSELPVTPTEVFMGRAEACAALYKVRELDLHKAVDALQAAVISSGLIGQIGQDAVQAIMAAAFGEVRRDV
jgi:hypothetical protein